MRVRDTKPKLSHRVAIVLSLCWGCSGSLREDLNGRPCTDDGRCVAGYTCSRDQICVRDGAVDEDADRSPDAGAIRRGTPMPDKPEATASGAPSETAAHGGADAPDPNDAGSDQTSRRVSTPAPSEPNGADAKNEQPTSAAGSSAPVAGTAAEPHEPQQPATAGSPATNACASGSMCGQQCVSLDTDVEHCGSCGTRCSSARGMTAACVAGRCVVSCPEGQTACGEKCVDVLTDAKNCGSCDQHCDGKAQCSQGRCEKGDSKGSGSGKKDD